VIPSKRSNCHPCKLRWIAQNRIPCAYLIMLQGIVTQCVFVQRQRRQSSREIALQTQ